MEISSERAGARTARNSAAARAADGTIRRENLSEFNLQPFPGRLDHELAFALGHDVPAFSQNLVELAVETHRVVVEEDELFDAGLDRKFERELVEAVSPAQLRFVLVDRVLRVVDQDVHPAEEIAEVPVFPLELDGPLLEVVVDRLEVSLVAKQ